MRTSEILSDSEISNLMEKIEAKLKISHESNVALFSILQHILMVQNKEAKVEVVLFPVGTPVLCSLGGLERECVIKAYSNGFYTLKVKPYDGEAGKRAGFVKEGIDISRVRKHV